MATKIREALVEWMPDALVVVGLAVTCYGVWLIHPASAYIIGGAALFALGALLSWKV